MGFPKIHFYAHTHLPDSLHFLPQFMLLEKVVNKKQRSNLVDDTRNDWASTPTQSAAYNIEVVVIVHAAQTTTSERAARFTALQPTSNKLLQQNLQRQQQLSHQLQHPQTVLRLRVQPAIVQANTAITSASSANFTLTMLQLHAKQHRNTR